MLLALFAAACGTQSPTPVVTVIPRFTEAPVVVTRMASLIQGKLVYDNGCLRVETGDGSRILLVWPPEYAASIQGNTVQVKTGQTGGPQEVQTLMIGLPVSLGGGSVPAGALDQQYQNQIPAQCSEPVVWVVGTIYSAMPTATP
jgi:hypothetical protein